GTVGAVRTLVMAKSAFPVAATVFKAMAVLLARLGSWVPEVMLATSTICVPLAVAAATWTTGLNVEEASAATSGLVQVSVPAELTGIVLQVQPAGGTKAWKSVVLAGRVSVKTALRASSGPLLVTF